MRLNIWAFWKSRFSILPVSLESVSNGSEFEERGKSFDATVLKAVSSSLSNSVPPLISINRMLLDQIEFLHQKVIFYSEKENLQY